MGYRSDVKILLKCDTEEQMTAFAVAQRMSGDKERVRIFSQKDSTDWGTGEQIGETMIWHYQDIKWYDGYPFIVSWTKLFREIEDLRDENGECIGGWAFARIGEESGDIETDCGGTVDSPWDYINVYTVSEFCD